MSILIKNGTLIDAATTRKADLLVNNGVIEAIDTNLSPDADEIIDAANKYVIPGAIDAHTHLDMPFCGTTSSDDFESGTIAAALGGTTSIVDFAIQAPGSPLLEAFETWMGKAEGKAAIDYGFHCIMREFGKERSQEMKALVREGVTSFKLFTAYPGVFMMHDGDIFRTMQRAGELGASISVHAENGHVINVLIEQALEKGHTGPEYHGLTRPALTESEAINRVITLAEITNTPVYIVHLSTAEGLDVIKAARARKVPVFAETCPQYLFLSHENYKEPNFGGAKYVMSPPLRKSDRQDELWQGLKNNDIQVVATDHCPFYFKGQKEMGLDDFSKIPNGAPGIETRLALMHDGGVNQSRFSLNRLVEVVSTNPAKLFGMYPKKGALKVGSDADIVLFDPNEECSLNAKSLHMKTDYSPYENYRVKGATHLVLSRGEIIVRDKKFVGKAGRGKFVRRNAGCMSNG